MLYNIYKYILYYVIFYSLKMIQLKFFLVYKYTNLAMYETWIFRELYKDYKKIENKKFTLSTMKSSRTKSTTSEKWTTIVHSPDSENNNYFNEFSYDNVAMGNNPCDNATILVGKFQFTIFVVVILVLILKL